MRSGVGILLDGRKLGDGGIGRYIENLVDGMLELRAAQLARFNLYILVSPNQLDRDVEVHEDAWLERWGTEVNFVPEDSAKYSLAEYLTLARRQRGVLEKVSLFHSPHYTLPFGLNLPSVVTVHDTIQVDLPENILHRILAPRLIKSALKRADHVLTVSGAALDDLERISPDLSNSRTVIPNAVAKRFALLEEIEVTTRLQLYDLPKSYFLFVGSDRPHKGFDRLLHALVHLKQQVDTSPSLVVVGDRFSAATRQKIEGLGLSEDVVLLGSVPEDVLPALYNQAFASLVPSTEEGFGLPVLESLACATPVVCTPVSSMFFTSGESAWVARDFSSEAFATVLRECIEDPGTRAELCSRGLQWAARFSCFEFSRAVCAVYDSLLEQNGVSETILMEEHLPQWNDAVANLH